MEHSLGTRQVFERAICSYDTQLYRRKIHLTITPGQHVRSKCLINLYLEGPSHQNQRSVAADNPNTRVKIFCLVHFRHRERTEVPVVLVYGSG